MKRKFAQKGMVYKQSYEIEATGNPVILENICPNCVPNVSISFSPIQAGEGNPSPENIRPISGWDSVWVTRCGKNLLDYAQLDANYTAYGLTSEKIEDNVIRISGTSTKTGNRLSFVVCHSAQTSLQGKGYAVFTIPISGTQNLLSAYGLRTFGESAIAIVVNLIEGESYDMRFRLMITADNSTPTIYEPYYGDTYDITLPETIYGGTVDAVTGEGNREWFTVILTGNETWRTWQGFQNSFFTDIEGHKNLANDAINVFCSNFTFDLGNSRYAPYHFFSQNPGLFPDNVRLCFTFDETVTNIDLAKQWIATQYTAGTPVTICYRLVTPTPFQATGNQPIPALDGVNTLYTNGDEVKFNCTILANPQPCNY